MRRVLLILLAAIGGVAFGSAPTRACSCPPPAAYHGFVGPEIGRLPANAVGVLWYFPVKKSETAEKRTDKLAVEVLREAGYAELPVKVTRYDGLPDHHAGWFYVVAPLHGIEPGSTYRFTDRNDSEWLKYNPKRQRVLPTGRKQVIVTVDHEKMDVDAPLEFVVSLPTIGTLHLVSNGGLCSRESRTSSVGVAVRLPVESWRDQLLYRTVIDGKIWGGKRSWCQQILPGRSWVEIGRDRIYSTCGYGDEHRRSWAYGALESTEHTLQMQVFLPGTDIVLETERATIDLNCPPFPAPELEGR